MINEGFNADTANRVIEYDKADLAAFGIPYIGNPDLAERFAANVLLNHHERTTYYSGGAAGYTDYDTYQS